MRGDPKIPCGDGWKLADGQRAGGGGNGDQMATDEKDRESDSERGRDREGRVFKDKDEV